MRPFYTEQGETALSTLSTHATWSFDHLTAVSNSQGVPRSRPCQTTAHTQHSQAFLD